MDEKDKKWASTISEGCEWIKNHIVLDVDEFIFIDKIQQGCNKILFERQEGE